MSVLRYILEVLHTHWHANAFACQWCVRPQIYISAEQTSRHIKADKAFWSRKMQTVWAGPLVLWSFNPLVLWSFGPLVLWSFGPLVLWSRKMQTVWAGPLVLWSFGPLVLWFFGPLVLWSRKMQTAWAQEGPNKRNVGEDGKRQDGFRVKEKWSHICMHLLKDLLRSFTT